MKRSLGLSIILAAGLMACGKAPKHISGTTVGTTQTGMPEGTNPDGTDPKASTMLTCSVADGKSYKGFGGVNLSAGRKTEISKDGDRYRVKPYTALSGEYTRVIGAVPASLTANAATFAAAPDRWYVDTQASAVTLFTSYRVAYEGALTVAGADTKYAALPTEESATANCTAFARQAWNRLPSPDEVNACKKVALVETAAETDIKARWAYTLASVLTAAGFLAY
ncbi:MAG TPA: hypothetical protein VE954_15400 [Oligoflexus sp.]|uniref:hypothetical protein n=1 Tax=Oligoflexus sp. TaxID=1971216 RepID=UPI002D256781|nr:hypothetical protein [Oligoflexus sp.]HYX34489.1 hypothetical protein [Oligoflexus sp.]